MFLIELGQLPHIRLMLLIERLYLTDCSYPIHLRLEVNIQFVTLLKTPVHTVKSNGGHLLPFRQVK